MTRKKKPVHDDSLSGQLAASGVDDAAERLRWMILTWDLAKTGDAAYFTRVFLTDHHYATFYAPRTPRMFARTSPSLGKAGSASSRNNPISAELARDFTDRKLSAGYAMVCKPLAVDLFEVGKPLRRDGVYQAGARHLVNAMQKRSELGLEVLTRINIARYDAVHTHLADDWEEHFTHGQTDWLWDGYGPGKKKR